MKTIQLYLVGTQDEVLQDVEYSCKESFDLDKSLDLETDVYSYEVTIYTDMTRFDTTEVEDKIKEVEQINSFDFVEFDYLKP